MSPRCRAWLEWAVALGVVLAVLRWVPPVG